VHAEGTRKGTDLKVLGEVLVLHGEVHGALEALDAGVNHLRGQPPERLLDVQLEVRVVQVVIPQTYGSTAPPFRSRTQTIIEEAGSRDQGPIRSDRDGSAGLLTVFPEARGDGVHVEARERIAARVHKPLRQRGHHRRHGGWRRRGSSSSSCAAAA
jgi:hypothetical protein